jgi:hypothetical protein
MRMMRRASTGAAAGAESHLRAMSRRCQASSAVGATGKTVVQRRLGISLERREPQAIRPGILDSLDLAAQHGILVAKDK